MSYLTWKDVAAECSSSGRPVCRQQVYRWVSAGVKVRGGVGGGFVVKLKPTQLPGGMVFTREAVDAFVRGLQGETVPSVMHAVARTRRAFARCAAGEIGTYPKGQMAKGQMAKSEMVGGGGVASGPRSGAVGVPVVMGARLTRGRGGAGERRARSSKGR